LILSLFSPPLQDLIPFSFPLLDFLVDGDWFFSLRGGGHSISGLSLLLLLRPEVPLFDDDREKPEISLQDAFFLMSTKEQSNLQVLRNSRPVASLQRSFRREGVFFHRWSFFFAGIITLLFFVEVPRLNRKFFGNTTFPCTSPPSLSPSPLSEN